ncbi:unnamed protein product [Durusdinium trenchii]|uniref:Meiosis-specific nuclear structural protein 1 n=1 Tax=Durusdinium trenchii TaxID=1381693 RepID=A0ABP0RTQ6_9DINO
MESTHAWLEERMKELKKRCQEMEAELKKLGSVSPEKHLEAAEAIQAKIKEEKKQTSRLQRQQMEEFKELHAARLHEEELTRQKREIFAEMEATKRQLQETQWEAERQEQLQSAFHERLQSERLQLRRKERSLEELQAVKVKFIEDAKEEKTRRQELREKMRAWMQQQEAELEGLRAQVAAHPEEMEMHRERREALRSEADEAERRSEELVKQAEESRRLIPVYAEQRQEFLQQIWDMSAQDELNQDELTKGQRKLLQFQKKAQERLRRQAAAGS